MGAIQQNKWFLRNYQTSSSESEKEMLEKYSVKSAHARGSYETYLKYFIIEKRTILSETKGMLKIVSLQMTTDCFHKHYESSTEVAIMLI